MPTGDLFASIQCSRWCAWYCAISHEQCFVNANRKLKSWGRSHQRLICFTDNGNYDAPCSLHYGCRLSIKKQLSTGNLLSNSVKNTRGMTLTPSPKDDILFFPMNKKWKTTFTCTFSTSNKFHFLVAFSFAIFPPKFTFTWIVNWCACTYVTLHQIWRAFLL